VARISATWGSPATRNSATPRVAGRWLVEGSVGYGDDAEDK
jgi:hypothetical protein